MKTVIEIWFEGECIEQRKYDQGKAPTFVPNAGDKMYIEFQNSHYFEEYGNWWKVNERCLLMFSFESNIQTVQLFCEPSRKTQKS